MLCGNFKDPATKSTQQVTVGDKNEKFSWESDVLKNCEPISQILVSGNVIAYLLWTCNFSKVVKFNKNVVMFMGLWPKFTIAS